MQRARQWIQLIGHTCRWYDVPSYHFIVSGRAEEWDAQYRCSIAWSAALVNERFLEVKNFLLLCIRFFKIRDIKWQLRKIIFIIIMQSFIHLWHTCSVIAVINNCSVKNGVIGVKNGDNKRQRTLFFFNYYSHLVIQCHCVAKYYRASQKLIKSTIKEIE